MRKTDAQSEWIFPAPTATGHIEKSTLKKQHKKALATAKVEPFTLYTFRHTRMTRWAAFMDPYTLAYLAGHSDFSTTRRYVHPQAGTIKAAMERARGGHRIGIVKAKRPWAPSLRPSEVQMIVVVEMVGARGFEPPASWTRTRRSSQAEPRPDVQLQR